MTKWRMTTQHIRYFSFLEGCKDAKACTVLLRGGSKDVLNEVERNLADAMQVQYHPSHQKLIWTQ